MWLGRAMAWRINLWAAFRSACFELWIGRAHHAAEAGPLLVSGRSLGDVQRTVQQLMRTQYRDVRRMFRFRG